MGRFYGPILWPNLHLLFWLSLFPFASGWMGENHFAATPVAAYGVVSFMSGTADYILSHVLIRHHGVGSTLASAFGRNSKGKVSVVIYALAIPLAFVNRWLVIGLIVMVALLWFVPDSRIEKSRQASETTEA